MFTEIAIIILVVLVLGLASSVRIIRQYERGVVFRFGRLLEHTRSPGLTLIVPVLDRLHKVSLQIVTMPIPAQEGITRDNVTVRVDAVVYFRVEDPPRALINVEDYQFAMGQVAQTSLRSIIGKSDLDDLLSNREKLNQGLELMIDNPALEWGVHIDRVEIKDVSLPDTMKRSIARQAEAERERRSRIISADGEYQASRKLSDAANIMSDTPAALQLRLLETVVAVAAERNSTLVLPFPVELLRFVDQAAQAAGATASPGKTGEQGAAPAEPGSEEETAEEGAETAEPARAAEHAEHAEATDTGEPSTATLAALGDPTIPATDLTPPPRTSTENSPAESPAEEFGDTADPLAERPEAETFEGTDSARGTADEDGRSAARDDISSRSETEAERKFSGYSGLH
ncbi:slipin family protein [Bounagaea algeriensis]